MALPMKYLLTLSIVFACLSLHAQNFQSDSTRIAGFFETSLTDQKGYAALRDLCKSIGHRLSGSDAAARSVVWSANYLKQCGADTVYLQEVMVPKWVRGEPEKARIIAGGNGSDVSILALGGSIGTGQKGLNAQVIETTGLAHFASLPAEQVAGKIVFFNGPMEERHLNTFIAYGRCVGQRWAGAMQAASKGAVGVIVRSVTMSNDSHPHTGSVGYSDTIKKIPAVAIATRDADKLSAALKNNREVRFWMRTMCTIHPDVKSHNIIAELKGNSSPDEILLVSGHIDSWDVGDGAHDDGAGCVHAAEVIRLFVQTGYRPARTVRVVFYMNEENGLRGATEYAASVKASEQRHLLALESDAGGFTPRGFMFDTDSVSLNRIKQWQPLLRHFYCGDILTGFSGADVAKLRKMCDVLAGYLPDTQRYFDHHHAATDVFESVHPRELQLGAAACAALAYMFDQHWP